MVQDDSADDIISYKPMSLRLLRTPTWSRNGHLPIKPTNKTVQQLEQQESGWTTIEFVQSANACWKIPTELLHTVNLLGVNLLGA